MINRRVTPATFKFPSHFAFPKPDRFVSRNGITLHRFQYDNLETAKIEFIFSVGSFHDDIPGKTLLAAKCLLTGSELFSANDINNLLAKYGAFTEISSSFDFTTLTLFCLNTQLKNVLPIIQDAIINPVFSESEVSLKRSVLISSLEIELEKTSVLASRELRSIIFKSNNYGQSVKKKDLSNFGIDDLENWYDQSFKSLEIIATGSVNEIIAETILNGIDPVNRKSEVKTKSLDALNYKCENKHVTTSNRIQTSIRFGKPIINRLHVDYAHLFLTNHILGGYFGSRLMKNLREKKGLTYGVYSSINHLKNASYLVIGCDVKSNKKDLTITEISTELSHLSHASIESSELDIAKKHLIGSIQNQLSSIDAISSKFKSTTLYGLTTNYYTSLLNKIVSADIHQINTIANKYLNLKEFSIVSVGR